LTAITVFILFLTGCVSKDTFEMLNDEATRLQEELTGLRGNQLRLQADFDNLARERDELLVDRDTLRQQVAALTTSKEELENILAAREDSLAGIIADQRQTMARREANHELQLDTLDREISSLRAGNERLQAELDRLQQEKERETRELSSTYEALLGKMKSEITKGQVTISELKGKLTVNLVEAILFDSGEAKIKPEGLEVLQKVIDILQEVRNRTIRIEGHTDNVPISDTLARKYPTNWELSAARAINVSRFLQERGIAPENLAASAYGEYRPVATNATVEGRTANRRIEIVLDARD
jgi:chemotaxis protein MotB